jgi:hypothetical protein
MEFSNDYNKHIINLFNLKYSLEQIEGEIKKLKIIDQLPFSDLYDDIDICKTEIILLKMSLGKINEKIKKMT